MSNTEVKLCLTMKLCKQFPSYAKKLSNKMKAKTACRLAAKNFVHEILGLHKTNAGKFLKYVRLIKSLTINSKSDFGDTLHSTHSEPFYYETAYLHSYQQTKLTIDRDKTVYTQYMFNQALKSSLVIHLFLLMNMEKLIFLKVLHALMYVAQLVTTMLRLFLI